MKRILFYFILLVTTLCSQEASAQDCSLFLKYNGIASIESIPSVDIDKKAAELTVVNNRIKEIKKANRTKLLTGIAAGVAAAGAAVSVGIAAGKAQKAKNEAAEQERIQQSQAEIERIRSEKQQQAATNSAEAQRKAELAQAQQRNAQAMQTRPQQRSGNALTSDASDPYGERAMASLNSSYSQQPVASESEQVTTGCAIVDGKAVPVQLKVKRSSYGVSVVAIKGDKSSIPGLTKYDWIGLTDVATDNTTSHDGIYAQDYSHFFFYGVGAFNKIKIYFN